MKKVVLASNNKFKIKEVKEILNNVEILTLDDIGFKDEIEETGQTFLENALIKAKIVSKYLKLNNLDYDVLADDSGICCLSLNLKPGIYSARYSDLDHNAKANRDKLISDLVGKDNKAYFTCTMVLYHINGDYIYTEGKTYGKIINEERGNKSFGYDCIFLSDDLNKTFGEVSDSEKNKVSHRYRALIEIKKKLFN